jgi:toxin ParE1/3/4
MKLKPVVLRIRAQRDVEEATDYYRTESGAALAVRFVAALEVTTRATAHPPSAGSPRYAHELNLPGLRTRLLKRFPYLVFYVERDDYIDVWRVLHTKRDIPARMQTSDDG